MPKEKNYNPVQAQRKADKAREVKKGKADARVRRDEKLARKNPDRLQKQMDDLRAVTASGGKLTRHEEQVLEGLDRELKAVRRARDALGDKAPSFARSWRGDDTRAGPLGKRRRDDDSDDDDDDDVEEEEGVRGIPMPRDTPPPIPKAEMDRWHARRRARRRDEHREEGGDRRGQREEKKEQVAARTVYEAKPVVRDLRGEAVAAFVPTSVQMKMMKGQGRRGLLEPEEADALEKEGYMRAQDGPRRVTVEDAEDEQGL